MKKYKIKEIFGPTFQGEGSYAGKPVMFLRFAGCNKWSGLEKDKANSICNYCDTDFRGGTSMTASEIVLTLDALGCRGINTLVISGGEPTLQLDPELCSFLCRSGFKLHLETNGSKNIDEIQDYFEHITCSPKQSFLNTKLSSANDLKILYPWIGPEITPYAFRNFLVYTGRFLQPVERNGDALSGVNEILDQISNNYQNYKLSLQTHKIMGIK